MNRRHRTPASIPWAERGGWLLAAIVALMVPTRPAGAVTISYSDQPARETRLTDRSTQAPGRSSTHRRRIWSTSRAFYNDIAGATGRSFVAKGGSYETNLIFTHESEVGRRRFRSYFHGRKTDNPEVSEFDERIEQLTIALEDPARYRIQLGDGRASFSPYTLSRRFEGLTASAFARSGERRSGVTALVGRLPRESSRDRRRFLTGLRLHASDPGGFAEELGLDWLFVKDVQLDPDAFGPEVRGIIAGLDGVFALGERWRFPWALAVPRFDSKDRSGGERGHAGTGGRVAARYARDRFTGEIQFEEVDPDFLSPTGGGAVDSRTASLALSGELSPSVQSNLGLYWSRNNLEGDLPATSSTLNQDLGLTLTPARESRHAALRNLILSPRYTRVLRSTSDRTQDTSHQSLGMGMTTGFSDWSTTASYHHATDRDRTSAGSDQETDQVQGSLGHHWKLRGGSWIVGPRLRLGYTRRQHATRGTTRLRQLDPSISVRSGSTLDLTLAAGHHVATRPSLHSATTDVLTLSGRWTPSRRSPNRISLDVRHVEVDEAGEGPDFRESRWVLSAALVF